MTSLPTTTPTIVGHGRGGVSIRKIRIVQWGRGALALVAMLTGCSSPQSDLQMDETFQRHRQTFDELREMLRADSSIRVVRNDWMATLNGTEQHAGDPASALDGARWEEYRAKFRQLGLRGGVTRSTQGPCEFYLYKYGSGFAFSSVTKGYAYCASEPTPLVHDLDRDDIQPKTITFRELRAHWYLFYEFD